MNCTLVRKLKPLLAYLVPIVVISPSLIWIVLDKSVWMWDQAAYGKGSVELFYTLIHSRKDWARMILNLLHDRAPGVSWLGQFFVPLGNLLGSIDLGLLLSILLTQALTLGLMYRSVRELSNHNQLVATTACLAVASAPLFVGMSHQYLAEPLQVLSVAWFVMIMSFAPKWDGAFILTQLLMAMPVAMLAKVSSPLYCIGPGLVALWYVSKRRRDSFVDCEWLRGRVIVALVVGVLLNIATIAWYYNNLGYVLQHVSIASLGPIAELYGKKDSFFNALLFWLEAVQNSFFLPIVLLISFLIFGFALIHYFINSQREIKHLTICSVVAGAQILLVLSIFSLNSNRDPRYLLPLLPYFTLLVCWSAAQIGKPLLAVGIILVFLVQFAVVYGQAFDMLSPNSKISGYLLPVNRNNSRALTVDSIISKTCTETRLAHYWNIVGDQKPWLNVNTLNYTAAKTLWPKNRQRCTYDYLGYVVSDLDETWKHVLSLNPIYYITSDPKIYPISADKLDQAMNQLNSPVLKRVRTSGLFEQQPALLEDAGILIFRRKDGERAANRVDYAQASAVAEHGVQSVRGARFRENFELLGASLAPIVEGGMELKLAWRSIHEVRLEYIVAVHFVDEAGNILAQADFVQDVEQARVMPGAVWVDRVSVPAENLKGAQQVGIALYIPGRGVEPIDRGPRDWDDHRLLLRLEKVGTKEASMRRE